MLDATVDAVGYNLSKQATFIMLDGKKVTMIIHDVRNNLLYVNSAIVTNSMLLVFGLVRSFALMIPEYFTTGNVSVSHCI